MEPDKKVLFISYFFEPHNGVGSQRMSYWAKNLAKEEKGYVVDVLTTTEESSKLNNEGIRNIYIVKNTGKSLLSLFIKDQGVVWKRNVKAKLSELTSKFSYDVVIMSGGPFMQFTLIPYIKKLFGCKVILDFRDPFSNNPRFNNGFLKVLIKKIYEKEFIRNADHIITVNDYCLPLLALYDKYIDKFSTIDNGFDERIIDKAGEVTIADNAGVNFVYAGTFYDDRNPMNFINVITQEIYTDSVSFYHIGGASSFLNEFRNNKNVFEYGVKSYKETIDIINTMNIGLVFTSGLEFESTSKIFDYIGLEKAILIITKGKIKTGRLHQITKDYPKVFWTIDNQEAIKITLDLINKSDFKVSFNDKLRYSRKEVLKKLISLLNSI